MDEGNGRRHLVVIDDDEALRALYCEIFESEGYRATAFPAPLAHHALCGLNPDLLILDLRLGSLVGGKSYLHDLKADPATASIPVLVCSAALDLLDEWQDDLERWSCAICPKPFELDELLDVVRSCLAESRVRDVAG